MYSVVESGPSKPRNTQNTRKDTDRTRTREDTGSMSIKTIFLFVLLATSVTAQSVKAPEKGSPERKAILDALRIPVEKNLKQKVVFVADNFNVYGNWAFVGGTPQGLHGGAPNYSKTDYADAVKSGAFDNNFFALLKKTSGRWKVITYAIGCTDVCYADWWSRFKAPKKVFPYTE